MTRGWTLMELIVVVTVLLVVAAIVYPLASGVRKQVLKNVCMNNLRQIGGLVVAYREDWDGVGKYGLPWEMGLPMGVTSVVPREEKKSYSYCPVHPLQLPYLTMYPFIDWVDHPRLKYRVLAWLHHVRKMKERSLIGLCIQHGGYGKGYDGYNSRRGIGLLLNGDVAERWGWTDPWHYSFWED